jgi:hypothetical protein
MAHSYDVIELLEWLKEDDPKKRVEVLCIWIKQHFISQVEDSINLVKEGITTEWIFKGLHKDNTDLAGEMVKRFNEFDEEVFITRLEVNTDGIVEGIKNDAELHRLIDNGTLLDIVNKTTVIKADYLFKEEE